MGTVNNDRVISGLAPRGWALGASALVVVFAATCILTLAQTDSATAAMCAIAFAMVLAFALLPPYMGTALLVFLAPIRLWATFPGNEAAVSLSSAVLVLLAFALLLRRLAQSPPALTKWEWFFVVWLAWMTLSVGWSVNPGASIRGRYSRGGV